TTGTASLNLVEAGKWFEAVDKWGSPADTAAEIEAEPEGGREHADLVLAEALPITSSTEPGGLAASAPAGARSRTLPGGAAAGHGGVAGGAWEGKEGQLEPGRTTVEVAAGAPAQIGMRRFAVEAFPVAITGGEGRATTVVEIPADRASRPWFMHVEAGQDTRV